MSKIKKNYDCILSKSEDICNELNRYFNTVKQSFLSKLTITNNNVDIDDF